MTPRVFHATLDPTLAARVVGREQLRYAAGADPALDRPGHVRAGSALAFDPERRTLAVVQDDASFLALVDLASGLVRDVAFPTALGVRQFDDARGNKREKLDLEAAIVLPDGRVIAFGSGSSRRRERVILVSAAGAVHEHHAIELYASMRATRAFAGSELNVEGAARAGGDVVFFQRGNGADPATSVDATARVALEALLAYLEGRGPVPRLREVTQWRLGVGEDGVRLTFTDGAAAPARGGRPDARLAFTACAEASPDSTRDGPVSAAMIGLLDDRSGVCAMASLIAEDGAPLRDKVEGVAFDPGDAARAWLVVDRDDAASPAELLTVALGPGWR